MGGGYGGGSMEYLHSGVFVLECSLWSVCTGGILSGVLIVFLL